MAYEQSRATALAKLQRELGGPFVTVSQFEEANPGVRNRVRGFIMRADLGLAEYAGLAEAIIRVGRSVLIDEAAAVRWLQSRARQPKSAPRNPHGRAGVAGKK